PPPKVPSPVLVFETRPEPLAPAELKALSTVTATAFGQRRKMLRQSLKALGNAEDLLAAAGIDPTRRAETVSVEGFCALARAFADRRQAEDGER
ncbi:MAG TPA: 16S rRNA (adenine(1518)-N(6)/adenine(1519)-N(6))-dimethyltransferase, partial [Tistrella mobilis]|nr:16S rRNA (adenine(1518)-N(6)/adenine(1519)-N(6))-dimethyltransferase [Tistrella mobilis]